MDPITVTISNLPPPQHWLIEWIPIAIAVVALIISLAALYWSHVQYRDASRPFVWLIDFASINAEGLLVNHPEMIATRVTNAPAMITKAFYEFYILVGDTKTIVHSCQQPIQVRYPDPNSQTTYTFAELNQAIQQCQASDQLKRHLRAEYTTLSGGKQYFYESDSNYAFPEKTWRVVSEHAS